MNSGKFVIGILIAALGVAFLGMNFHWWSGLVIERLSSLWPALLVIIGLRILLRSDSAFILLTLLMLAVLIPLVMNPRFAGTHLNLPFFSMSDKPGSIEMDQNQTATFSQDMAVLPTELFNLTLPGRYDIAIKGSDTDRLAVELNGPEKVINALSLHRDGDKVVLSQADVDNFTWFHWGNNKVSGTISLPKTMAMKMQLSGFVEANVTDMTSQTSVSGSGAMKVKFDRSTSQDVNIDISGAGEVNFDSCTGTGQIEISGAGKVTANSCTLSKLSVRTSGASSVDIKSGSIGDLTLKSSGASQARLPKPTGKIDQDTSGPGKVEYLP